MYNFRLELDKFNSLKPQKECTKERKKDCL